MRKKWLLTAAFITLLLMSATAATQLIYFAVANPNPFLLFTVHEGDVSPTAISKPPIILLLSPENYSQHPTNNVSFTLNVSVSGSTSTYTYYDSTASISPFIKEIYYKADWQPNITYVEPAQTVSLNLTGIPEGNHSIVVYANEWRSYHSYGNMSGLWFIVYYVGTNITGSSVIKFTIDTTSPKVSILSLENKTYNTPDVPLNFTVSESVSQVAYSLDGQKNVTVAGNTTLTGLSIGDHNLTVYVNDEAGNVGASETIYFSIFPTTLVIPSIASVTVIGVSLLVYFKKRKRWLL